MGAEEELVRLFEKASAAAENASSEVVGGPEEFRCTETIKAMHAIPVTAALLISTQIGRRLRRLTKHSRPKIRNAASDLVEWWKTVVAAEVSLPHGEASSKPAATANVQNKVGRAVDMKVEAKVKSELYCADTSVSNAKVYTQHIEISKVPLNTQHSNASGVTVIKDVKPLDISRIPKTKDVTRDKVRELLAEALARVASEAKGHSLMLAMSCDPVDVAVSVETVMFETLGLSKGANKVKYRSVLFNIKDSNNPDFRRRVLLGEISPADIINLTPEEMASDQRRLENEKIKKKALFECERGNIRQASTDQFKCGKCKKRKCTYFQMQTRSADEPMTTFVTCVNCNNRWKFC